MGWAYANTLSPETMVLLTRVGDDPVLIFVDRAENRHDPVGCPGLNIFERSLDQLVLYEVTPRKAPGVLSCFFNPGMQPGWEKIIPYP